MTTIDRSQSLAEISETIAQTLDRVNRTGDVEPQGQ